MKGTVFVVSDDLSNCVCLDQLADSAGLWVRYFESVDEFLRCRDPATSAFVVLDVRMPALRFLDLLEQLTSDGSRTRGILVSSRGPIAHLVQAVKAGIVDCVPDGVDAESLAGRIDGAFERNGRAQHQVMKTRQRRYMERLTRREHEVLHFVLDGKSNSEIAESLDLAERSVELVRANVLRKGLAKSVEELARVLREPA